MDTNKLSELRNEIDTVDTQIIDLIAKRMQLVHKVGIFKKEHSLAPLDKNRWSEVIATKVQIAKEKDLSEEFITAIWNEFHKMALEIEESTT